MTLEERARLAVVDLDQPWCRRPPARGTAWQWIAPCGHGKSTHLLALMQHFRHKMGLRVHYVYVEPEQTCGTIPDGDALMLDEMDRLPKRIWPLLTRTQIPLFIGTHRCLKRRLKAHGYTVQSIAIDHENDAARLREVVHRRIRHCQRSLQHETPTLQLTEAAWLIDRFGSDFRRIEHELYERLQQKGFGHGEV
ncbi:MAG: hypothetical protein AAGC97_14270 [Planctomycetota bacterium]